MNAKAIFDESHHVPTVLVAYAKWNEPSLQLLNSFTKEATSASYAGRLRICALDVDAEKELIKAMQITNIPAALAVFKGKAIDSFVGAIGDDDLKKFVKAVMKHAPSQQSQSLAQQLDTAFAQLNAGSIDGAEATLKAVLASEGIDDDDELRLIGVAGMLQVSIGQNNADNARQFYDYIKTALLGDAAPANPLADNKKKKKSGGAAPFNADVRVQASINLFDLFELSKSNGKRWWCVSQNKNTQRNYLHILTDELSNHATMFLSGQADAAIDALLQLIRETKGGPSRTTMRETTLQMISVVKSRGEVEKASKLTSRLSNYWFS
jgi:thioredoxin-like negative regulator of GroEL